MYSWNDPDDRVAIAQMNADLRHAQLDLLSAECATDRLRLRFSAADLARYPMPPADLPLVPILRDWL